MKKTPSHSPFIQVEVLVRKGCSYSDRVLENLNLICKNNPYAELHIHNSGDPEPCRKSFGGMTPSIWVNGKLWYLGSFNAEKFKNKLQTLDIDPPLKYLF